MGVVQKYGGTSVESIEKIKNIAKNIAERKQFEKDIVIVVSAMGKKTDELIYLAKQISSKPNSRELDMLLSTGEQQTIALLTMALEDRGLTAISFTGYQAGIETDGPYTKNKIRAINTSKIKDALNKGKIVVVAGFQGVNSIGDITTLGRGGSDTSAVALAAALGFTCEIYTDVDGIYSIDPRKYELARKLKEISYDEMMEMASLGAGVMEPRAVEIAKKYNVEIYVARSHSNEKGTYIREVNQLEERVLTGLSATDNVMMISVSNIEARPKNISKIFSALAKHNTNVDMISQTAATEGRVNLSFTCPEDEEIFVDEALKEISIEFSDVEIVKNCEISKLSVVGIGMRNHSGVAAKIFEIFSENDIPFGQVTTSEISISYTLNKKDAQIATMKIAEEFNL